MPTYVLLMKLTEEGAKNAKKIPERLAAASKGWEAMGGKVNCVYVTMGPYDYVAIGEGPDDETAAAFALGLATQGQVTTTTLKAFSPEEVGAIVGRLP